MKPANPIFGKSPPGRSRPVYPVPEIVHAVRPAERGRPSEAEPHPWVITDGAARISIKGKKLQAPLAGTPRAQADIAHEMGHLAITPAVDPNELAEREGVDVDNLQICEDARVNAFLVEHAGVSMADMDLTPVEMVGLGAYRPATHFRELVRAVIATYHQGRGEQIRAHVKSFGEAEGYWILHTAEVIAAVAECGAGKGIGGIEWSIQAARMLDAMGRLDTAGRAAPPPVRFDDEGKPEPGPDMRVASYLLEVMKAGMDASEAAVPWGTLTVENPPRHIPVREYRQLRAQRPNYAGIVPRYPHRILTDGRAFASRKHVPGLSLLIDASGSMTWSMEQLTALLAALPGAWVGLYSGDGTQGTLYVLAERGQRVGEIPWHEGVGNIVDGPALEILCDRRHPKPWVWVSDGMVTGHHDQCHPALFLAVAEYVAAQGVIRVENATALFQWLGLPRPGSEKKGKKGR